MWWDGVKSLTWIIFEFLPLVPGGVQCWSSRTPLSTLWLTDPPLPPGRTSSIRPPLHHLSLTPPCIPCPLHVLSTWLTVLDVPLHTSSPFSAFPFNNSKGELVRGLSCRWTTGPNKTLQMRILEASPFFWGSKSGPWSEPGFTYSFAFDLVSFGFTLQFLRLRRLVMHWFIDRCASDVSVMSVWLLHSLTFAEIIENSSVFLWMETVNWFTSLISLPL